MNVRKQVTQQLVDVTYSLDANLSHTRQRLIDLVRHSDVDPEFITLFNQSRQPNGTYKIDAGDLPIINTAKSLINLLYSLQRLTPTLFRPLAEYCLADGWGLSELADLVLNAGVDIARERLGFGESNIINLKTDITNLMHHLSQLKHDVSSIPSVKENFLPLMTEIQSVITESVEPIVTKIEYLQLSTKDEDEAETLPVEYVKDMLPRSVLEKAYQNVAAVHAHLGVFIEKTYGIQADLITGLYDKEKAIDENATNLMRIANILVKFNATLQKINSLISRRNINPYQLNEIFFEISQSIVELQGLNVQSMMQVSAEQLLKTMTSITKALEPVLIQVACYMDIAENQLGIRANTMDTLFKLRCREYEALAKQLNIKPEYKHPFWEHRLQNRQGALLQSRKELQTRIADRDIVANTVITVDTSLRQLLAIHGAIQNNYAPEAKQYRNVVAKLIDSMTGMRKLNADIKKLERAVIDKETQVSHATTDIDREHVAAELQRDLMALQTLYQCRHELERRIEAVKTDTYTTDKFSYQSNGLSTGKISDQPIPISHTDAKSVTVQMRQQAVTVADEIILGKSRHIKRLASRVDKAELELRAQHGLSSTETELQSSIARLSPESLFTMPLNDLRNRRNLVISLDNEATVPFVRTLQSALEDRLGITEIVEDIAHLKEEKIRLEAEKQQMIVKVTQLEDSVAMLDDRDKILNAQAKLNFYMKSVYTKLVSGQYHLDKKPIENISLRLGISEEEVTRLLQYNTTWAAWLKNFAPDSIPSLIDKTPPLIKLMQDKLKELNNGLDALNEIEQGHTRLVEMKDRIDQINAAISSSTSTLDEKRNALNDSTINLDTDALTPLGNYRGTNLSLFESASQDVIQVLRKRRVNYLLEDLHLPVKTSVDEQATAESQPFMVESTDMLLTRLVDKSKSGLLSNIAALRRKMVAQAQTVLDERGILALSTPDSMTGFYPVNLSDSILVRIIKHINNSLLRLEELADLIKRFQVHKIKEKSCELKAEIDQLLAGLDQLKAELPNLPDLTQLSIITNMRTILEPTLSSYQGLLNSPIISGVLDDIISTDFSWQITRVMNTLQVIAAPPQQSDIVVAGTAPPIAFKPFQEAITALDALIERQKISMGDSEASPNIKNLSILKSILADLQNAVISLASISQGNAIQGQWQIMYNVMRILIKLKDLDLTQLTEAKEILKNVFVELYPIISTISARVDLSEQRLGVKEGLLTKTVADSCHLFDSLAIRFGVAQPGYYPYFKESINFYNDAIIKLQSDMSKIQSIKMRLEAFSFKTTSLADFVMIRDTLLKSGFSTDTFTPFLTTLDSAIEEITGLPSLRKDKNIAKKQHVGNEQRLIQKEDSLATEMAKLEQSEQARDMLARIKEAIGTDQALSFQQLKQLHALFSPHQNIAFDDFCALACYQRGHISGHIHVTSHINIVDVIDTHLNALQQEIRDLRGQQIPGIMNDIQKLTDDCKRSRQVLHTFEEMEAILLTRIDDINHPNTITKEFSYDQHSHHILSGVCLAVTKVDTDNIKLHQALSNMQIDLHNKITRIKNKVFIYAHDDEIYNQVYGRYLGYFKDLEFAIGLKPGTFTNHVRQFDQFMEVKSLRGVFSTFMQSNPMQAKKYDGILMANGDDIDFLNLMRKSAEKNSNFLGRLVRRVMGRPSFADQLYNVSTYFLSNKNRNQYAHFINTEKLTESAFLLSTSKLSAAFVEQQITTTTKELRAQKYDTSKANIVVADNHEPALDFSMTPKTAKNPYTFFNRKRKRKLPHPVLEENESKKKKY